MANRRCFQTLISRCLSTTSHSICKTVTPNSLQIQLTPPQTLIPMDVEPTTFTIFRSPFSSFSRNFCSKNRINDRDDNMDEEEEDDVDDESEADESLNEKTENLSGKSDEEKAIEASEIGYKVIGPLEESDRVFKPYEPLFAVIQIGSHQFKVSNGDSIYIEKLKYCDVNDKLILNRVLMLGSKAQTIIGRPMLPDAAVHAIVEEHALDAKVIIFKKKRRKNYRRTKGHRQELTKLRITDIQGIDKPETAPSIKTKMRAGKKVEKVAVSS
ncbi:hypothetical protein ACH5RR_001139 [Cinchona calisaya]|uniref:Large ribosomal subunit protein bL21m n=1 Tax=Cinchona calisaya TaxID=153742 RepID=A0ABD3B2P8_9GENT